MKIDIHKNGNNQVRTYTTKSSKKELQDVINDILGSYKINTQVIIEIIGKK